MQHKQGANSGVPAGDGDLLDTCILTENGFPRGDVFLKAQAIGGLHMIDLDEADDNPRRARRRVREGAGTGSNQAHCPPHGEALATPRG